MSALVKAEAPNAIVTRDVSPQALALTPDRFTTRVTYEKVIGAFLAVAKDIEALGVIAGPKARAHGFTAWSERNNFTLGMTSVATGFGAFFTGMLASAPGSDAGSLLIATGVAAVGCIASGVKAARAGRDADRQADRAKEHRATASEAAGVIKRVRNLPPELRAALKAPIERLLEGEGRGVLSTDAQTKLYELLPDSNDALHARAGLLAGWMNTVRVTGYPNYETLKYIAREMPADERKLACGCIVDALGGTSSTRSRPLLNAYEVSQALARAL